MKTRSLYARIRDAKLTLRLLVLALPLAVVARAQEAQPAVPPQPSATSDQPAVPTTQQVTTTSIGSEGERQKEEQVLKMNPFVVQQEQTEGYYTENTMAGSRLNTNLGDLAASITVVTRQQMLDTASVDMNDIFMYEANTEGTESSYTSFSYNGTSVSDNSQASPVTANRIRGISPADRAQNYYYSLSAISMDVYNTESVDILRGPNSLLFGTGSPSGIVNEQTTQANLTKQFGELEGRYGSWGSVRQSFRWNQPVANGKFAIFVGELYSNQTWEQKPSNDIEHRYYVAFDWQPTKNTTVRGNFEHYTEDVRAPQSFTPQDGITPWINAGKPTWNPLTYTLTVNGVSTTYTNNSALANAGLIGGHGSLPTMFLNNNNIYLWEQSYLSTTSPIAGPFNGPALAASTSPYVGTQGSTTPLFNVPGINNPGLYNWSDINMQSGVRVKKGDDAENVEIIQQITPNFYAQLGWFRQDYAATSETYNGNLLVTIDPNTVLLDGTANPFLDDPYQSFNGNNGVGYTVTRNDNFRLNLAYVEDLTKYPGWVKWLGVNRLFAFGETHYLGTNSYSGQISNIIPGIYTNPHAIPAGSSGVINEGAVVEYNDYVGSAGVITHGGGYLVSGNVNTTLNLANYVNGAYVWTAYPVQLADVLSSASRTKQQDDSWTIGWQGSLLDGIIVPTLGLRRDRNISYGSKALPLNSLTGMFDLSYLNNNFNPSVNSYGYTRTKGVVVKPLNWVSLSFDESANFTPSGYKVDIYNVPLPLPTGVGKDYGLHFNLFNNKLVFGINYFTDNEINARGTPADSFIFRAAEIDSGLISYANTQAINQLGTGASPAAIAAATQAITQLPAGYTQPVLGQIGGTSTVSAHGIEGQAIWNPIPNWNMKATVGTQKTVYSNIAPQATNYVAARLPVWEQPSLSVWWNSNDPVLGSVPSAWFLKNYASPLLLAQELQGKQTQGQRPWSASGIMTYRFVNGPLKYFTIGGAVRLQAPAIIGYLGMPPNAAGIIVQLDPNKPVYDDPIPEFDGWLKRSFKLPSFFGENIRASVQLNVKDLAENGNWLQRAGVNPDGTPTNYRIVEPRQLYLDVTFDF